MTTKTSNLEDAKKVVSDAKIAELELAAKAAKLTQGVVAQIVSGKNVNVEKAIIEWDDWMKDIGRSLRTRVNNSSMVKVWSKETNASSLPPSAVTSKQISLWVNSESSGNKLGTRKVKLSALRSFFEFCSAKGWSVGDPARLVRVKMDTLSHAQKERRSRKPMTEATVSKLIESSEGFWNAAITIARWTGLRLGDIASLEWDCFAKPGFIIVWTDKRDRRVELPMNDQLRSAVSKIELSHMSYVFPDERDVAKDPAKRSQLSVYFGRLCKSLGIAGHSFHDLRATYASECKRLGVSLEHIAGSLGHSSVSTTMGYIKDVE